MMIIIINHMIAAPRGTQSNPYHINHQNHPEMVFICMAMNPLCLFSSSSSIPIIIIIVIIIIVNIVIIIISQVMYSEVEAAKSGVGWQRVGHGMRSFIFSSSS